MNEGSFSPCSPTPLSPPLLHARKSTEDAPCTPPRPLLCLLHRFSSSAVSGNRHWLQDKLVGDSVPRIDPVADVRSGDIGTVEARSGEGAPHNAALGILVEDHRSRHPDLLGREVRRKLLTRRLEHYFMHAVADTVRGSLVVMDPPHSHEHHCPRDVLEWDAIRSVEAAPLRVSRHPCCRSGVLRSCHNEHSTKFYNPVKHQRPPSLPRL